MSTGGLLGSKSMAKTLPWALLGLLTLVPAAMAEDAKPTCPDGSEPGPDGCAQNAWVEDCPPDMMCAYGDGADGNAADGNATDGPTYGDCGGEVCAYDDPARPISYGPDDCIDCSGPVDGGTCMDGSATDCDDVQYLDGREPARGPSDGSCPHCRGEESDLDTAGESREASGVAAATLLGIAALVGVVLRRR
jgi:hypothetical protein